METIQPRPLPGDLELQLLLGRALDAIYELTWGDSFDKADSELIERVAKKLDEGVAEMREPLRSIGQSADALELVVAAQNAFSQIADGGTGELPDRLQVLAKELGGVSQGKQASAAVRTDLEKLYDAVVSFNSTETDEAPHGGAGSSCSIV